MFSRLTEMIQFLYACQRLVCVDPWEDDPKVSAEFKRRWPDVTEAETEQARKMAQEMFAADTYIKLDRGLIADPPPPDWH